MRKSLKIISVILCISIFGSFTVFASDNDPILINAKDIDYTITSPYADVDWDSVDQYKTALHCHTNASDGNDTLRQSLQRHYETGFDIVANTDHGTCNTSWSEVNYSKLIHDTLKLLGRTEGELDYLGTSGQFESGVGYKIETVNGDDYLITDTGRNIMRIPYGIENGAVSVNAHVNSWFAPYQDNGICDYERTIKGVDKAEAICVINHPGEYTKGKEDLVSEDSYRSGNWAYNYYINKFYGLIDKYDSCIGIDMNSKGDSRTRYDRELWDILLQRSTPKGKNVFAICSSDAHQLDKIDTGFTYLLMNEKTSANARKSLETGAFFSGSHCNGNYLELVSISQGLKEYYGETELYNSVKSTVDEMAKKIDDVQSGKEDADSYLGITWKCLDDQGYCAADTQPAFTGVSVNEDEDTITLSTEDALLVRWIADGECIAVTKSDEGNATLDLDEYSDKIGAYVRAEAFGDGGIVYTQPFILSYDGQPEVKDYKYVNVPVIDCLFAEIRVLFNVIVRSISNLKK